MLTFDEVNEHLMIDDKPSIYLTEMYHKGMLKEKYPYTMLSDLIDVPQSPQHHPEGNVWNHTLLVLDHAAERKQLSKKPQVLMWSALLHDLGKAPTTRLRKGKITSYDHDKWSETLAVKFLKELKCEEPFIEQVSKMVRWHMQILFVIKNLPFADIQHMASEVPLEEIALLGLCDRMGRGEMSTEKKRQEEKAVVLFLEKCQDFLQRKTGIRVEKTI